MNDPRGLAPAGWHIPSDAEWATLITCLGEKFVAGGRMKYPGTSFWAEPNTAATNVSGFAGLPGSLRMSDGGFLNNGQTGYWWSSTERNSGEAWDRFLNHSSANAGRINGYSKKGGFPVRCIRD